MLRFDRRWMFALAAAVALLTLGDVVFGACSGVLHVLPFALMLLPLLRGRYLCERYLVRAARRRRPRRGDTSSATPIQPSHDLLLRGGALLATGLARRPPPLRALV